MSDPLQRIPLSECLALIRNGTAGDQVSKFTDFPVTRIETIANGEINWSKVGYLESCTDSYRLEKWDILYSHINSYKHIGKVAQYDGTGDLYHGMNLLLLRANSNVDPKYLFYSLCSYQARSYAQRECQKAINQVSLNTKTIGAYKLYLPIKAEQKAIANILDTLDTQIRQTEAIIAKLQRVKQGLLQDLLTRGIDVNGKLRPPCDHAPELYKDSPLGWIPREWEAVPLGQMLNRIEGGWSPNCPEIRPSAGEWGVLKVSAVTSGVYKDHSAKVLSTELKPRPGLEVKEGDVILTRANGNPNLVAKTVMVDSTQGKLMLSDKLLRLVPESSLLPFFLCFLMDFYKTRHQVASLISGSSGQKNISQKQIRGLMVPQLALHEQELSVEKVQCINSRIVREHLELSKLRLKKSGLMDDLLTGRVRVTSLLDTAKAS